MEFSWIIKGKSCSALMQRRAQLCGLVCSQGNQQNLVTHGEKEKVVSQSENDNLREGTLICTKFKFHAE